jgi:hypothetical protein
MAIKVSVGVSKKVGLPAYGSAGASCDLELEVDPHLLESDLAGFHERLRAAYVAARQAVEDELVRLQGPPPRSPSADEPAGPPTNGHAHAGPPRGPRAWGGPARPEGASRVRKPASAGQVKAIYAIARAEGADLDALLGEFGAERPEGLTMTDASKIIDKMKAASGV